MTEFGNLTDSFFVLIHIVSVSLLHVNMFDSSCLYYSDELKLHQAAIHLKSTPVSNLLPALVKTKPALGTPSMVKVEPASPGTPADKLSLDRKQFTKFYSARRRTLLG